MPPHTTLEPFSRMHAPVILFMVLAFTMTSNAADKLTLAEEADKSASQLPQGCIVTATQTAAAAPIFSVSGKQEPAGVPPENVVFEIGSISKVFTAILLAQAVIEKKVTLDTTLREMMGPSQHFADERVAAITLRQLATHTSGLPRLPEDLMAGADPLDPYAHYDRTHLDAYMAKVKLAHAPPFPTDYSNLGVGLLGDQLARLYHGDWEKLVLDRVARPLGMKDTCVTLTAEQIRRHASPYMGAAKVKPWHFTALAGAGALHSTAADLLRFAASLDQPATTTLKDAIELIEQPQGTDRFGLCLLVSLSPGKRTYWYQGGTGGYGSWVSADPATHERTVVLINNSALPPEKVLFGEPPAVSGDPALAAYAGEYDTGVKRGTADIHYTFEVHGSNLWMQITGQPFVQLEPHPTAKDRFEFKPVKAQIQFTRKKDDIVSATLFQSGTEIHAKKLPPPQKTQP